MLAHRACHADVEAPPVPTPTPEGGAGAPAAAAAAAAAATTSPGATSSSSSSSGGGGGGGGATYTSAMAGVTVTVHNLTFEVVDNRPRKARGAKGGSGTSSSGNGAAAPSPGDASPPVAADAAPPPPRRFCGAGLLERPRVTLLRDVTAAFPSASMSAIMGPSGCGKTTLLDVASGRKTHGRATSGSVLFAGRPATPSFLRHYTGYVEQHDTLISVLTPREMLLYTAELKNDRAMPREAKRAVVERLLDKLGLRACADVNIGSVLDKGISGGELRRCNIGLALVSSPRVLFLDEPTSGLDSSTANEVMGVVRHLAVDDRTTVIFTIHTPTAYAFSLFDSLLLMAAGRPVYYGPARDASSFAVATLLPAVADPPSESDCSADEEGKTMPVPLPLPLPATPTRAAAAAAAENTQHPAEMLMDLMTAAARSGRSSALADAWQASPERAAADEEVARAEAASRVNLPADVVKELATRAQTVTPGWWAFLQMARFRTCHNYASAHFLGPRIGDKLFLALLIVTLYLGMGRIWRPDNYINVASVVFAFVVIPSYSAATYVPALFLDRALLQRERADGLYNETTYFFFKMFDELLVAAFGSFLGCVIVFYGVGLSGSLLVFWLIYYAVVTIGVLIGYLSATLSPTLDVANCAVPSIVAVMVLFSGFLLRLEDIPVWWRWLSYVNPLKYALAAQLVNHFGERNPKLFGRQTVLDYFGAEGQSAWGNMGIIWCFTAALSLMAWSALHRNFVRR